VELQIMAAHYQMKLQAFYFNSTSSSVISSGNWIGSSNFNQIFNKSRFQFYQQRYIVGGMKFTHSLSDKAFYTLDFQTGFVDQDLQPFSSDTTGYNNLLKFYSERAKRWYYFGTPEYGTPNNSTNYDSDPLGYICYKWW
jgi:hypothetical protein